jgi:hypothetical protein
MGSPRRGASVQAARLKESTVGKLGLTAVSLAAAIPGGILTFLMLMALLNSLEKMPTILKAAALMLLVVGAAMALFPAYLLIWYRGSRVVLARDKKTAAGTDEMLGDDAAESPEDEGLRDSFLEGFSPDGGALDEENEIADDEFAPPGEEMEGFAEEEFPENEDFSVEDTVMTSEMDVHGLDDDFEETAEQFSTDLGDDSLPTAELDIFEAEEDFDSLSDEPLPAEEFESDDDLLGGAQLDEDFEFEPFEDDDEEKS